MCRAVTAKRGLLAYLASGINTFPRQRTERIFEMTTENQEYKAMMEEREERLRSYASDLVGFTYGFGIPEHILLMPEEGAREYMRDVHVPGTLKRASELMREVKRGKYVISKDPILDAHGKEWYPILDGPAERH